MRPDTEEAAAFLAGFVAAEGSFIESDGGRRFTMSVGLGTSDRGMCEALAHHLGCGSIHDPPRRREHYDDESAFAIRSLKDHLSTTIPFMDEHLPPSYKREQYLAWRDGLLDYWEHRARRVRPCTVEECDEPRRAHGLCRRHLYEQHGV